MDNENDIIDGIFKNLESGDVDEDDCDLALKHYNAGE